MKKARISAISTGKTFLRRSIGIPLALLLLLGGTACKTEPTTEPATEPTTVPVEEVVELDVVGQWNIDSKYTLDRDGVSVRDLYGTAIREGEGMTFGGDGAVIYSVVYNGGYMLGNLIFAVVVLALLSKPLSKLPK